jgi:hypothetical protein
MAIVKVLDTGMLSLFFEGNASGDTSLEVQRLSLRTSTGLVTASTLTPGLITVGTTWNFGASTIAFVFPAAELDLKFGTANWSGLRVELSNSEMRLAFTGLRAASNRLPGLAIDGLATLVFVNGGFDAARSIVNLRQPAPSAADLQMVWTTALRQIRLDWTNDSLREITLAGPRVMLPASTALSLVLDATDSARPTLSLLMTVESGQRIECRSGFAWERGGDRELQAAPSGADVFEFSAAARQRSTVLLTQIVLNEAGLPKFLQQLRAPLAAAPAALALVPLAANDWTVALAQPAGAFQFPFLQVAGSQFIQLESSSFTVPDFVNHTVSGEMTFSVKAGGLSFGQLRAVLRFNWETFALSFDHGAGIVLRGPRPSEQAHLGLSWRMETDAAGTDAFDWFVLATENFHYQLQLAPQARFVIEYSQATKEGEPIRFVCRNFALTERGISLSAEVTDDPARLNGINTRFSFHGTRLELVENAIQDFTLMGSGPLPPDLVGDATADISLQFKQEGDTLKLVAGAAELKGTSLLQAKMTHFEFEVSALGLKFVDESGYHLYFTLSGSATYSPEPFDEDDDPLHFLSSAKIELVECPLTGDATVLARHINFLVEFNEPLEFKLLGTFTFELRAIGFLCAADEFDGDAALQLTGQIMFSPANEDTKSAKVDFHGLLIGAPLPGDLLPRLHFGTLGVEIEYGDAFHLSGEVEFRNTDTEKGFLGEGVLEIKGMPTIAASFAFLRVRLDEESEWVSAWFIFIEVRKVSFKIPVVEIFLREVGLGFGYRFTLTSIKTADQEQDLKKLIGSLRELSRTAGDLSKRDRWAVDLEQPGEDPRWTIAFRAMFSQTSASTPLKYNDAAEENLPCVFLFDAVAAVRSDLTFFMAARGWINTNYNDFINNRDLSEKPLVSGFVIISARQKRLLAQVASNPDGDLGERPKVPDFVKAAMAKAEFSATLLIEPGLFHLELGWPNMLRWSREFGPLKLEFRGGFIFRVTAQELVMGISFQARASLDIQAEISLVVVGARLEASMRASLGARLLAVTSLQRSDDVAVYAAVGIDVRIAIRLVIWIGFKIGFINLTKEFTLSFSVGFTAGLELGVRNTSFGLQGSGTIFVEVMGHELHFHASFAHNPGTVTEARLRTARYMNIGLEATEVEDVPGIQPVAVPAAPAVTTLPGASAPLVVKPAAPNTFVQRSGDAPVTAARTGEFAQPNYIAFTMRDRAAAQTYFLLMPKGEGEAGFLPAPPPAGAALDDFTISLPANAIPGGLQRFDPFTGDFAPATLSWKANWAAVLEKTATNEEVNLADYLKHAYLLSHPMVNGAETVAVGDPIGVKGTVELADGRVHNPTDASFEAAVRGAVEQFHGSPMFKRDPNLEYDKALGDAFDPSTTVYRKPGTEQYDPDSEHAIHFRGAVVHALVEDFRAYVSGRARDRVSTGKSIPFQMGLVFRVPDANVPDWLTAMVGDPPKIRQRKGAEQGPERTVTTFNVVSAGFDAFPPRFERVKQYASSNTIALAWDLVWDRAPESNVTASQKSPEHHLLNYQVRRRPLEGGEREVFYTVKNASAMNRGSNGRLEMLRPRFKVVDHFNDESLAEQAALPSSGRAYLYTITPCDVAGNLGRPLSLVVTRFPDEPPAVPANAEFTVSYKFAARPAVTTGDSPVPVPVAPAAFDVTWRDPVRNDGLTVPIRVHRLIFRRTATLPLGSYGLDAATSQPRRGSLPTSNARPLPTDIRIELDDIRGTRERSIAAIPLQTMTDKGVFPDGAWRPESWSVFIQTESVNGVPSALAPVTVKLKFAGPVGGKFEERQPGDLEFLPQPIVWPLLPPEDQHATTGIAHFPMPAGTFVFDGTMVNARFRQHPEATRLIRFRWNQGPSGQRGYPMALHAGFTLLELNIDANTDQTFRDAGLLSNALWDVQEVRMLPAADLLMAPSHTLSTSQWEAWYPSTVSRIIPPDAIRPAGSEAVFGSWYSWRESRLEWPAAPVGEFATLHGDLGSIVDSLRTKFVVDLQVSPPLQEMDLAGLLQSTAPGSDPYGWGLLQRFGLSIAFSLRSQTTGVLIAGADLLAAVKQSLPAVNRFLHVELLYQPSRAVSLDAKTSDPSALLGIVQLSLRPAIVQDLKYFSISLTGSQSRQGCTLTITPTDAATLLDPLEPAAGEIALTAAANPRTMQLPLNGSMTLLVRSRTKPEVTLVKAKPDEPEIALSVTEITAPTDSRWSYFRASAETFTLASLEALRPYCEMLNSNRREGTRIVLPATDEEFQRVKPDLMVWLNRFFDASAIPGGNGPWVATAYPRSTAQVFTAPDESGRLSHDYLLTDKFAHNLRYYVRPFGRYDLLWRSLLQSPLFEKTRTDPLPSARPDPNQGALDVVLHRTQPVAMPVVLRSGRLDAASVPGQPARPGSTWEVIVAKHPEQSLAERNQTVFRQLSYRGIAFTLLRKFAFESWIAALDTAAGNRFPKQNVIDITPTLPEAPGAADHLDLAQLTPDQARTLDLPLRLPSFTQGALVLQWAGLPFYYEHRLLLVAQSSGTVSPVNDIVQRDFEYLSPAPSGRAQGIVAGTARLRHLTIPLNLLWDSLPAAAQEQWPAENPNVALAVGRKPGALPDLDVVYQVVHLGSGNVEVQAEVFFDLVEKKFLFRQLAQVFEVRGAVTLSADYRLGVSVSQTTKVDLKNLYDPPAGSKAISSNGRITAIQGVLTPAEAVDILKTERTGAFSSEFGGFAPARPVSRVFNLPPSLAAKLDFPQMTRLDEAPLLVRSRLRLDSFGATVWLGGNTTKQELRVLKEFATQLPTRRMHRQTLLDVANQIESHSELITFPYRITTRPVPGVLIPGRLELKLPEGEATNWTLVWSGVMTEEHRTDLLALPGDADFKDGIRAVIAARNPDPAVGFDATIPIAPTEPGVRVKLADFSDQFAPEEIAAIEIPSDEGDLVYRWRRNEPLPLPSRLYVERVSDKLGTTQPRFVEVFAEFMQRVSQRISNGPAFSRSLPQQPPLFLRGHSVLSRDEAALLLSSSDDAGIPRLIQDLEDQRTLDNLAQDWFSTAPVSARLVAPPDRVDFPEPQQCTLVWTGDLTSDQRLSLQALAAASDEGFGRAIQEILDAPEGEVRTGVAAVGFDQVPRNLAVRVLTSNGRHTGVEWNGAEPMLDRDVLLLKQWAPMAPRLGDIDPNLRFGVAMIDEDPSARPRPKPRPDTVPAALAGKLSIEPRRLSWSGRLTDRSQLDALESLSGDDAFNEAIRQLLVFLRAAPVITFSTAVPQRPVNSPEAQLLIGRAVIRYHGLMTAREGGELKAAYPGQSDQAAIQRLFDGSMQRGLQGSELRLRTRRGSAAPSAVVALEGEPLP